MNKIEEFRKSIKIAKECIEEIKDTQLKVAAFKVILGHLISENNERMYKKILTKELLF